ncbi:MAG: UDP-N-acetyl-D-glucosamine dehydrogenase, partial [Thalassolituus oleivorans]
MTVYDDPKEPKLKSKAGRDLLAKIETRVARIGVVGLGYVGLPLLWTFHREGFSVIGFDIDESKIEHLGSGTSYIRHFSEDRMSDLAKSERCTATTDFNRISEADAVLLCVPTPLDSHREPDMSYVERTVEAIGPHLRSGQIVILESTTYPGTTREVIVPSCERLSGLSSGSDFFVAYSPEREDPGNPSFETSTI